jgi:hypothetical protein
MGKTHLPLAQLLARQLRPLARQQEQQLLLHPLQEHRSLQLGR